MGGGTCGKSPYFLLNFAANLIKLALKENKVLTGKKKKESKKVSNIQKLSVKWKRKLHRRKGLKQFQFG